MSKKIDALGSANHTIEVDLFRILTSLWKHRPWLSLFTLVAGSVGIAYAFLLEPVYRAEAVLATRQPQTSGAARLFNQLGGAGLLGLENNSLDQMEVIIRGYGLAESVIVEHDLLPAIFPDQWDKSSNTWKLSGQESAPSIKIATEILRKKILKVTTDRGTGIFSIAIEIGDSTLARDVVNYYIEALKTRVRTGVMRDAEANREYLEAQLAVTTDPVLREKIQAIIALQIEKAMFVSSQPFDILEEAVVPLRPIRPNRKLIFVVSLLIGFFTASMLLALRKAEERHSEKVLGRPLLEVSQYGRVPLFVDIRAFRDCIIRVYRTYLK